MMPFCKVPSAGGLSQQLPTALLDCPTGLKIAGLGVAGKLITDHGSGKILNKVRGVPA